MNSKEKRKSRFQWQKLFDAKSAEKTIDDLIWYVETADGIGYTEECRAKSELNEKAPSTFDWLMSTTYLYLSSSNMVVEDLTLLGMLTELEVLQVRVAPHADLSPLANLTNLKSLHINDAVDADYSFLAGLTELTDLRLYCEGGHHFEGFRSLNKLERLVLRSVVRDLQPLAEVLSLRELEIDGSQIESIEPLRGLPRLKLLFMSNNRVRDISPLARMRELRRLWLAGNCITDFSPLDGLPELTDDERASLRSSRQLDASHPPLQTIFADWENLELWASYARWLIERDDLLGLELVEKLEGRWNQLPLHWGRPVQYEEKKFDDGQWYYRSLSPSLQA